MTISRLYYITITASALLLLLCWNQLPSSSSSSADVDQRQRQRQYRRRRRLTGTSWLDPKTIMGKTESSTPTINDSEINLESLRIVAFGTSKTWGAGLCDNENENYVKLLSPTAVNLGLRATPADYPSLCFHSLIGNQVFDVIILEFSPFRGPQYRDFDRLARRVRTRFPTAIIIYLPIYMLLEDVSVKGTNLKQYLLNVGVQSPNGLAFVPTIRHLPDSELSFGAAYAIDQYKKTVQDIGAHMIEFPSLIDNDIKSFVIDNAKYYTGKHQPWDFVHPSALGHQVIAQKIRHTLSEIYTKRPPTPMILGTWLGGQDRCISWFSGGNLTDGIRSVTEMDLVNFIPRANVDGKWSLEVNQKGGSLSLDCLFPNCNIYISYMAKGPSRDYPKVLISVNDEDPILVDPHIPNYHVRQMVHAGTARKPGVVSVSVKPIPEDKNSKYRFRITGIITTPITY